MRPPDTLRVVAERARAGEPWRSAVCDFLDGFVQAPAEAGSSLLEEEPPPFDEVGDAYLAALAVVGELYVVGGAAIALAFDERRATRDVDAVFEPKLIIYEEAARVADELHLPAGWLNDGVTGLLAGPDPWPAQVFEEVLDLVVRVFGDRVDLRVELFVREVLGPEEQQLRSGGRASEAGGPRLARRRRPRRRTPHPSRAPGALIRERRGW